MRGIAIISVIWFHAFPSALRSGFIGVDVFFVISGFLISSIIFSNLEHGTFSYREFFNRRIRRIFPALVVVMAVSFLFGWFALTAEEFKQLGKHLASGAGFISNFVLWSESGYFDNAAETKPMLHLWSLAIEEQFYIFWPLLLGLTWKRHGSFLQITSLIAVVSFAISIYLVNHDAAGAFYSPIARFWELMIGGLLAYISLHHRHLISKRTDLLSLIGFTLLVTGLVVINRQMLFPGAWALLPVLGTFFLIAAGPGAWINRNILANRGLIWFGLISYPLYLWHWPLLSLTRIIESQKPSNTTNAVMLLIAIALGWLTYRFIERPVRFSKRFASLKVKLLLIAMILTGAAGLSIYLLNGVESRESAGQLKVINQGDINFGAYGKYLLDHFYPCTPDQTEKIGIDALENQCFHSKKTGSPEIVIIGDSHAQHLFPGIASRAENINIGNYIKAGQPTLDDSKFKGIYNYLIHEPSVKTVIISAYWTSKVREDAEAFKVAFRKTVRALTDAGKRVYIANDVPDFPFDPGKCKYEGRLGLSNRCTENRETFYDRQKTVTAIIESIVDENDRAELLNTSAYFCDAEQCSMARDGTLYYRDRNHLNLKGSQYIGAKIIADYPAILVGSKQPQ